MVAALRGGETITKSTLLLWLISAIAGITVRRDVIPVRLVYASSRLHCRLVNNSHRYASKGQSQQALPLLRLFHPPREKERDPRPICPNCWSLVMRLPPALSCCSYGAVRLGYVNRLNPVKSNFNSVQLRGYSFPALRHAPLTLCGGKPGKNLDGSRFQRPLAPRCRERGTL